MSSPQRFSFNRRQMVHKFLKFAGALALTSAVVPAVQAEEKRRAKKTDGKTEDKSAAGASGDLALPWVKPGAGMAASVNYVEQKSEVKDEKLKTARQEVPFKDQKCSNCMLYSKVGDKDKKTAGKCTIFAGQLVAAEGWCTTWAKKA